MARNHDRISAGIGAAPLMQIKCLVEADQRPYLAEGDRIEEVPGLDLLVGGRPGGHLLHDREGGGNGLVERAGLLRVCASTAFTPA